MKRNLIFCIPFLFLWALALPLGTAHGQGAVDILNNTMDIQFPSGVVFALEAESPGVIENVDLFYGTSERTCQAGDTRQAFDFDPDPRVDLSWEWEWNRSGILPPGAQLWWEWEITLESGEVVRTPRETITVEDQRFDWQRIDEDEIVVRWINGDEAFGRRIHDIALESLAQQSREMGISQDGVIVIDTTWTLTDATWMYRQIRSITEKKIIYIIYRLVFWFRNVLKKTKFRSF